MSEARKFLFDRDFGKAATVATDKAVAKADEAGYARGLAAGQSIASNAAQAQLAAAMNRLADMAGQLLMQEDARQAEAQALAGRFALAFARKLAGEALRDRPLALLEEAARECFGHLRGVPHLVVRVNDALVEDAEALMKRFSHERGYEGRVVVFGDPDLGPADARLEWADGGVATDETALDQALTKAVAAALGDNVKD
jgi:flagellar assembly protein FliH